MTCPYETGDNDRYDIECAVHGNWHMHIAFYKGDSTRTGSRYYQDGDRVAINHDLHRIGLLWSESPWRSCISLQEFVDGVLG